MLLTMPFYVYLYSIPCLLDRQKSICYSKSTMVEALFAISLQGELLRATFFKADDVLLKDDIVDEYLIERILKRASSPRRFKWSFTHDRFRIDILKKCKSKVEFFVSIDEAIELYGRNLVMYSNRISFH